MSVISISSGLCSQGRAVAKRLAEKLSYQCVSREVLLDASEHFNIPEIKLSRAIENAPSILDRFFFGKEIYIAYIKEAILSRLEQDNIIYHGLAGHFFLQNIPHILKVRIVASMEDRIQEEIMQHNTTPAQARKLIEKDDQERRKWSQHLYGMDTNDSSLYDLVVNVSASSVDKAVDLIINTLNQPGFQTTDVSRQSLERKSLEAKIHAALVNRYPKVSVRVTDGSAYIGLETGNYEGRGVRADILRLLESFKDQINIEIDVIPILEAG